MTRPRSGKGSFGLFVLLLSFLFIYFGLLPAHGAAHHATTPSSGITISSSAVSPTGVASQNDVHDAPTKYGNTAQQGQPGHDSETPVCHTDSHNACFTSGRSFAGALADLSSWLALAAASLAVIILALRYRNAVARGSWSSRPRWRPSGTALLALSCVSRT